MTFSTPDLCDEFPEAVSVAEPGFHNFGNIRCFSGEIVTIKCYEDNSLVREWGVTEGKQPCSCSGRGWFHEESSSGRHAG